ncbi:MAG: PAS domain S-box protein, partial [Deltaproteobacteria bacterium]
MPKASKDSADVSELKERIEELEKRLDEANRRFSLFAAGAGKTGGNNHLSSLQLAILDSLHDVVAAILDRDGNYLAAWVDPALTSRYGLDTSEVVGRNLRDIFPPDEAEDHIQKLRACFDEGATHREENPVPMPNGIFWHDTIISPLKDPSGKVVAALKFAQDITNSKRLERDLDASENLYQAVLEQVTEFIVVHSSGRIIYANRAASEAAGLDSKEKMKGMSVLELVHPDSRELVKRRLRLASNATGPLPPMEEKFIGKDGKVFIGEVVSQPVQLGGERAILTVVRDVTERRKLEEEKNRMRERASSARRIDSLSLM